MQLNELMKVIISPVDVNLYGENGFKERIPFEEAKLRTDISVRRVSISYKGYHQFLNVRGCSERSRYSEDHDYIYVTHQK